MDHLHDHIDHQSKFNQISGPKKGMPLTPTRFLVRSLLTLMAFQFNHRPSLRKYLKSQTGWINFSVGFTTEQRTFTSGITFTDGKVKTSASIPEDADVVLVFADDTVVGRMLQSTPNEVLNLLLQNRMRVEGNFSVMSLFNFYLSLLLGKIHRRMEATRKKQKEKEQKKLANKSNGESKRFVPKFTGRLKVKNSDPGVRFLENPYLSEFSLDDFPRLGKFLDIHFDTKPVICHERPALLTEWYVKNGFETDIQREPHIPELRQAHAFSHLMKNRKPIIRKNDLLAGTTTAQEIGVVIYPETHGTLIWSELLSVPNRELNPYDISEQTIETLHNRVFPFWINRNPREWVRKEFDFPLCQRIDERFAVYFVWKSVGISHTIPDFPKLLRLGIRGVIEEIDNELAGAGAHDNQRKNCLEAMKVTLQGVVAYSRNLATEVGEKAKVQTNPERKKELEKIAQICARVPEHPAGSFEEAVQSIWTAWIALHLENTNTGLSLGRLDQWLQPYFESDMEKLKTKEERAAYLHHAIELIGCLFLRCTDHLPLIPDIGNYLFGGASSDQAITLGGVTPEGKDAVNDLTYVFLKVTQMLAIRDPNMNARYHPNVNSDDYLQRLCEVNLITTATPSMHNDQAVFASLSKFDYPKDHIRDWSATGCVEPTLSGKHSGHTGSLLLNMVAALEMALNNGRHPLMNWDVGPKTGEIKSSSFKSFDEFFEAFKKQLGFCIDHAVKYNNMLAKAHSYLRPTPLLSSLIEGCIQNGLDATKGGALYNSSGTANIGLVDVADSLMAIKHLVFDTKKLTFEELTKAIGSDFNDGQIVSALARNKVPLFGSGNSESVEMTNRIIQFVHEQYGRHKNFRNGPYTAGFWSMSNHVAFGTLAGALPSGRNAKKAFTPGLTPQPVASDNLLDNLHDVAALKPEYMDNNIAFNVKVFPGINDSHERVVERMKSYVKGYFLLGGMQMQMNAVTSDTLRDAMANPDNYKNLLVRISGYNAYFVTLNRDMQLELIERAEYGLG